MKIINNPNDIIPKDTTHVVINCQYLGDIPNSVIHLEMNHNVYSYLPNSIVYLTLGHNVLDSYNIPVSVRYLFIDNNIIHHIPNTVESLRFSSRFTHSINNMLPLNLKRLSIGKYYQHEINLPKTLEELFIYDVLYFKINITSNLRLLHFLTNNKQKIYNSLENIKNIPHNCTIIDFFGNEI